jgi:deoxyribodipyrimidine photo-lyase
VNDNLPWHLEECAKPQANSKNTRNSKKFASLFDSKVPEYVKGFELDKEDKAKMEKVWPAGEAAASEVCVWITDLNRAYTHPCLRY